jgi:ABC-2 type transport system ATP-binding protein
VQSQSAAHRQRDLQGPIVLAQGLDKRFGDTHAVQSFDMRVDPGSICGLLGPNGAGKTTVIRILTTLLRPDAGTARVAGLDVVEDAARVRFAIGLAGQQAAVDELLTGRANLEMVGRLYHLSPPVARRRAGELIERFDLAEAADRPAKTYSGGMRRRLDLAASLVATPPVLFLDEPTTGLDPRSRNEMWTMIRELVDGGTTLLLTTQYLDEADRLANRITVIDGGRAIAEGTPSDLKRRVGGERIDVIVDDPARLDDAAAAMARATGTDAHVDHGERRVTAGVHHGGRAIGDVIRELDAAGVATEDVALRRPTLDDVFLRLTGHTTETGTGDDVHDEESEEVA